MSPVDHAPANLVAFIGGGAILLSLPQYKINKKEGKREGREERVTFSSLPSLFPSVQGGIS
ncbi:MAG: hypothetical protein C4520_18020 [Candidatus Abyssobacteria bacterium SURF_5]|uniref:Uncharacterized protein n=1 Tax=Abyssobacteria bacterium (strain SURF_5) TaxID=2093360 RepID=A0A3A4NHY1_ABYX5|nr:MAG: hypothetical protein C4520_18020 [Candidatus Abyssubacteria bacterium SURF_5]